MENHKPATGTEDQLICNQSSTTSPLNFQPHDGVRVILSEPNFSRPENFTPNKQLIPFPQADS